MYDVAPPYSVSRRVPRSTEEYFRHVVSIDNPLCISFMLRY